jgi:translation elongation factor EF-G
MGSSYGGPPQWLVEIAIEPKSRADQEQLSVALATLTAEDPSFHLSTDRESGQTILKAMGELHLAIKIELLKNAYKIDANIGAPQVAFLERVTRRAEVTYIHEKQTGRTGQFAGVSIVVAPNGFHRSQPRDTFSNRLISRSRLSRLNRCSQNMPLSWSISCWWHTARRPSDSSVW